MSIKIGTRGSRLALAQTSTVCKKLATLGIDTEQVIISTQGDTTTGVPLHEIGGQGVFVRALDDAILAGQIDCAVQDQPEWYKNMSILYYNTFFLNGICR